MTLGYIGLGKMGFNMTARLAGKGHRVVAYDTDPRARAKARRAGARTADSIKQLMQMLTSPRIVWLMVPHHAVDGVLRDILKYAKRGDTIIDGGNSHYADTVRRAKRLAKHGVRFLDAGVSGGPEGAKRGACVMVGGERSDFKKLEKLFRDISGGTGYYLYVGKHGAGHFVKMVHNGIEYGMMQAVAEGFAVLKRSPYRLNVKDIAELYNKRSVIESRLIGWLGDAYGEFGAELKNVSGAVAHTGEGEWTIRAAKKLGVLVPVIAASLAFRKASAKHPSYTGKVLSALRNQFGGHKAEK
jgi:6-phosphogluconate dehydrogenase